jgi:hypothetical protein|tara:strand:- start:62 stop:391 length:330 start_codon:yes stop_codon:yes gene_type:complete
MDMTFKPYKKQIGGSHYKNMIMQPSEFINKNRLPFAEGSAIKYICRHAAKGKEQDIEKAIHYLEMILERDYEDRNQLTSKVTSNHRRTQREVRQKNHTAKHHKKETSKI